jgi:hypothetical protein
MSWKKNLNVNRGHGKQPHYDTLSLSLGSSSSIPMHLQ